MKTEVRTEVKPHEEAYKTGLNLINLTETGNNPPNLPPAIRSGNVRNVEVVRDIGCYIGDLVGFVPRAIQSLSILIRNTGATLRILS